MHAQEEGDRDGKEPHDAQKVLCNLDAGERLFRGLMPDVVLCLTVVP